MMFRGKYAFLSNFLLGHEVIYDNIMFPTTEHLYQSFKIQDEYKDEYIKELISSPLPNHAKYIARKYGYRFKPDFLDRRLEYMDITLDCKYEQHPNLIYKLLETGSEELIEGNYWHDNYWGDCICRKCEHIEGENHLGKLHMVKRKKYSGLAPYSEF